MSKYIIYCGLYGQYIKIIGLKHMDYDYVGLKYASRMSFNRATKFCAGSCDVNDWHIMIEDEAIVINILED